MTDRPILFSAPMIAALLAGRKTMTRRALKPRGRCSLFDGSWTDDYVLDPGNSEWRAREVRYAVGDRLWCREAWRTHRSDDNVKPSDLPFDADIWREADREPNGIWPAGAVAGKLRPGMFMPRWASRITLLVDEVKVERLQEISEDDAVAEGMKGRPGLGDFPAEWDEFAARRAFRALWNEINGPDAWATNPWVAAIRFRTVTANIDSLPAEVA